MRRFILIPLLAFGTIAGFASGFHSLAHHHCHGPWAEESWHRGYDGPPPWAVSAASPAPVQPQVAPAAPAPVQVQTAAPAPASPQTLVIPIIVGVPAQGATAPSTTYVIPTAPAAAAPAPAAAPTSAPAGK